MELIRTLREKRQTQRQQDIMQASEECIRLADFDDSIYIAYNGLPLVPVEKDWNVSQILEKLKEVRDNYVKARLKDCGLPRMAAML